MTATRKRIVCMGLILGLVILCLAFQAYSVPTGVQMFGYMGYLMLSLVATKPMRRQ